MRYLFAVAFFLMMAGTAPAQETWMNYGKENVITDVAVRGDYIWCATTNGLVRWDRRDMSYRKYTMQDGLPHSVINSIDIAPDGTVWCGTVGGVARFDGSSWRVFRQAEGLPETSVALLAVGPDGMVWAGTYFYESYVEVNGSGISRYDGADWKTWRFPEGSYHAPWVDQVSAVITAPDSTVWVGNTDGVCRFTGTGLEREIDATGVTALCLAPDKTFWVAYRDGIIRRAGSALNNFTKPSGMYRETSMTCMRDGTLWVGTPDGLFRFDGNAWKWFTTRDGLGDDYIGNMTEDESGVLWVATHDGLSRFDGTSFRTYRTVGELISNSVTSLAFEPNGTVWAGTSSGISRYNGRTWRSFTTEDGLPDSTIKSIAVTPKGDVWAAASKCVAHFIGSGWKTFTMADGLADSVVYCTASGPDNSVWFGTPKGVTRFDGATWKTYREPGNTSRIVVTPDGTVWCGSAETISRFDGNTWTPVTVGRSGMAPHLSGMSAGPGNSIFYITTEITNVHYQSYRSNLFCLKDSIEFVLSPPYGNGSCFSAGADGTMWFGHYFGFSGMNRDFSGGAHRVRGGETTQILDSDGLVHLGVNVIASAPDGAVWFGTNGGLSRYGPPLTIGVESGPALPKEFAVMGNYPNPFNPSTTISFTLPRSTRAELSVYSITGQRVRTLLSGPMTAGTHSAVWDGRDDSGKTVSSGIYITQLRSGKQVSSHKMLLVK